MNESIFFRSSERVAVKHFNGRSSSTEVTNFLENIEKIGKEKRKDFIDNCSKDENNLSKYKIKNTKIINFQSTIKKGN